jgi:class 3 adenylate cyclase
MKSAAVDLDRGLEPIIEALVHTRWAAIIYDPHWTLVWVSDELAALLGTDHPEELGLDRNVIEVFQLPHWRAALTADSASELLARNIGYILHDQSDGGAHVRALLSKGGLDDVLDGAIPSEPPALWAYGLEYVHGDAPPTHVHALCIRLHKPGGEPLGTAQIYNSGFRAGLLDLLARGDRDMYERMAELARPGPRAVAILFADLEGSGKISRDVSSASYFSLIQTLTRSIDTIILGQRGIVGKHAGDGVTAFFIADQSESESAAARAALAAGIAISRTVSAATGLAEQAGLASAEVRVNIGVHWGAAVFMGQLVTDGRLEVTALGAEVNECARIQETATGGQLLGSRDVIEKLTDTDAAALAMRPDRLRYVTVGEMPTAGAKAIRDAGSIPVAQLRPLQIQEAPRSRR